MFQALKRSYQGQRHGTAPVLAAFDQAGAAVSAKLADRNFSTGFEGLAPAVTSVLARARNSAWRDPALKRQAIASVEGIALAVDNGLARQARLHLRELNHVCSLNTAGNAVAILSSTEPEAKPFAVCDKAARVLEVKGPGYDWRAVSIHDSGQVVPAQHLAQLSRLRQHGIVPDSIYIAVPYSVTKEPLSAVLADEIQKIVSLAKASATFMASSLSAAIAKAGKVRKMPDPLLLAGFGSEPMVLVELGRWI